MRYAPTTIGKEPSPLISFSAAVIASLFFATGNFGLLNVLGIRRETQTLLMMPLVVAFVACIPRSSRALTHPLWLLAVVLLGHEVLSGVSFADLANGVVVVFVTQILLSGGSLVCVKALKIVIWLAAVFAVMGLTEAVIFFLDPGLILQTTRPYLSDTGAATVALSHPIQYLGFNTAGEMSFIFGHPFTRLNSFASEPSVLVSILFLPGLMALMLTRLYRVLGSIILLFVVGPVQAGTVWLSCAFGAMVFVYLASIGRMHRLVRQCASGLLLGGMLFGVFALGKLDVLDFTSRIVSYGAYVSTTTTVESKTSSSNLRLGGLQEALAWVVSHPIGSNLGPDVPGIGIAFYVGYLAGVLGMALCVWLYLKMLQGTADTFFSRGKPLDEGRGELIRRRADSGVCFQWIRVDESGGFYSHGGVALPHGQETSSGSRGKSIRWDLSAAAS